MNDELGVSYGVSSTGVPQLLPLLGEVRGEQVVPDGDQEGGQAGAGGGGGKPR